MQDLSLLLVRTDLRSGPEAADLAWMLLALFLVVLGFALVLYLQNRHYTLPLTRLMHRLNLETAVPGQRLYRPDRTISLMENRLEDIHEQHLEKEQEIEQSRQQLRSAWLNCLIFDETTWAHPLPALEIDFPYSHLLCLMFSAVPSGEEMKILSEALLPLPCQMEIFENAHREWVALLNLEATQAERVPFLLQSVVAALPDADLAFGVGLPVERTAPVGVSYRCARRALTERYFSRDQRVCVFHTETAHASNEQVMSTILAQVAAMPRRAAAMKTEEALELSEAIVSALKSLIPYMGTIRSVMLLTGAFFLQTAYDFKASPQEVYGDDLMRIYYHLENINGYRERMRQDCLSLAEYMRQQNSSSLHGLVQLALEVISRTPPSALSTQTVADALGISTGHLSRIFHQETGEKLVDCLQRKKMDCAARLLREGDYSNEKICELIGYSRVQYFAAKFREYSGLSPSEYRRTYGLAGG